MWKKAGTYSIILSSIGITTFILALFKGAMRESIMVSLSFSLFGLIISALALIIDKQKVIPLTALILNLIPFAVTFLAQK